MLGNYQWLGLLKDGTQISQLDESGGERSVEVLQGQPVVAICLMPTVPGFMPIQFDVEGGEWVKCWTRTFLVAESPDGEITQQESPCIDKLGFKPKGSDVWMYLYIYHTGVIRFTTEGEP